MVERADVAKLYVATFNRAPDADGLDYWTSSDYTLEMIAESFFDQSETQALYPEGSSNRAFVEAIYANLFDRLPDMAGLQYWVNALDNGAVSKSNMILAVANGAQDTADHLDATLLANKTEVGLYYADQGGEGTGFSLADVEATAASVTDFKAAVDSALDTSSDYTLTAGTDNLTGTTGADTFEAAITQNPWAGGVSNTLSTADHIDGGAGSDTLHAELVPEFFGVTGNNQMDIQPHIKSVEDIQFEAMDVTAASLNEAITVDAKNITDVVKIGSSYSDGDLVIENLTTLTSAGTLRNTDVITVTMDHTDNFDHDGDASDLTVLFDEDYLLAGQVSSDVAYYFLEDREGAAANAAKPLANINTDGLQFTVDGVAKVISLTADQMADFQANDGTWAGYTTLMQAALAEAALTDSSLAGLTLELSTTVFRTQGLDGTTLPVPVPAIVLSSATSVIESTGFHNQEDAPGQYDVFAVVDNTPQASSNLPVSIDVELDKVGRDGEGGNLTIGAKNNDATGDTDVDQVDGIHTFNITVKGDNQRPSNLGQIISTNGALSVVNIASEANTATDATYAALTVRGETAGGAASTPFGGTLATIDATAFKGDLTIGTANADGTINLGSSALNVDTFTATGGGEVEFNANIQEEVNPLTGLDIQTGTYSYTTGANTDTVRVNIDGDAVDTLGESFVLSTGGGADAVTMTMDAGVSQETMEELSNLDINLGGGDDSLNLNAYGNFDIDAGAGNDFVRINSVGANGDATVGTWTFGAASVAQETAANTFAAGNPGDARVLYQAKLTVSFAGFEKTVDVDTDANGNFLATQVEINAAIKEAIESDTNGLAKLLTVTSGSHEQLTVTSNVGGENDLSIDLFQPQLVAAAPAAAGQVVYSGGNNADLVDGLVAQLTAAGLPTINTSAVTTAAVIADFNGLGVGSLTVAGTQATGTIDYNVAKDDHHGVADADANAYLDHSDTTGNNDGTEVNFSTIKAGLGDDVVVLHSNIASSNKLDLNDSFGTIKVVNFHNTDVNSVADASTDVGVHALDFTELLTDKTSASGSVDSEVTVNNTVNVVGNFGTALANPTAANADNSARTNSVNVVGYDETLADSISFDSVTMAQVVAALNGDAAAGVVTGGLADATLTAVGTDIVGTTQNHIIMLENNENPGEYKVFHVTSTVDAGGAIQNGGDFTGVTSLGTIDFGASINFSLAGNADYEAFRAAYLDFVDNGTAGQTFAAFVAAEADHTVSATYTDKVGTVVANPATPPVITADLTATTDSTLSSTDANPDVFTLTDDATSIPTTYTETLTGGASVYVEAGKTLTYGVTDATGTTTITLADATASVTGTAANFAGDKVNVVGDLAITQAAAAGAAVDLSTVTSTGTTTYTHAGVTGATLSFTTSFAGNVVVDTTAGSVDASTVTGNLTVSDVTATGQTITTATGTNTITTTSLADGESVTVAGDDDVTVNLVAGDLAAGGATGNVTVVATTGTNLIVTGAGADTIDGGADVDSLTGGAGVDSLTGGAGADVFVFATGDTGITLATADTIADFSTAAADGDTLKVGFAGATAAAIADGSGLANEAALIAAADLVFTAGAGANDDVYAVYNFNGTGNGYVLIDNDDSGSFDAGDTIIKLTGVGVVTDIVLADFIV